MISQSKRLLTLLAIVFLSFGCEKTEEESEEAETGEEGDPDNLPVGFGKIALGGIGSLPNITEPVSLADDAETNEFDAATGSLAIDQSFSLAASTGIALGSETTDSDFNGKSYSACRMVNRVRGFLHMAAASDAMDCELQFILGDSDTFFDGETHVLEIVEEDDGETLTQKYQIKIDGGRDAVKGYTIHACEDGSQNLYLKKTIDENNQATILSKRVSEPDNPQVDKFWGRTTVTGAVDENGKFTGVKIIDQAYSNKFSSGALSFVKEEVKQSSKNVQYTGYMSQDDSEDPERFLAYHQLIDKNTDEEEFSLEKYFIGDGAMAFDVQGNGTKVQGWNGDTKAVNNDSNDPYVSRVDASKTEIPGAPEAEEVKYEGEEIFDCTTEAEVTINDADLYAAFLETLELRLDGHGQGTDGGSGSEYEGGHEGEEDDGPDFCLGYELPQNVHLECRDADSAGL